MDEIILLSCPRCGSSNVNWQDYLDAKMSFKCNVCQHEGPKVLISLSDTSEIGMSLAFSLAQYKAAEAWNDSAKEALSDG